jgi:hypothetical protein
MKYSGVTLWLHGYRPNKPNNASIVEAGRAFCPAHQSLAHLSDIGPGRTLSVALSTSGAILLHCHAGCSAAEICAAVGVDESDLFPDTVSHIHGTGKGIGTTWYSSMALADAIDEECTTLILAASPDELHQKIHNIGQLVLGFKTACRIALKGGAA